jgi:hypothetical protein
MSGQTTSIGSMVLGAVLIVGGAYFGQPQLVVSGILLLAGGAIGMSYKPKADSQNMAAVQDLKIASAVTGMPFAVVFGTARVTPNFIRSNKNFFSSKELFTPASDPGPKQGIGFNYYHKWEMDLCMGEIDAVGQVFGMPGERPMIDAPDPWVEFDVDDSIEITLAAEDEFIDDNDDHPDGGVVRVYRGGPEQVRLGAADPYAGTGIDYKNIAWALFGVSAGGRGFSLGTQPTIATYQFMVRRRCRCIRDDGSTVTGIKVRGSADSGNPSYHLANPAAIYYEVLTNKVWGRGLSSDIIDEDSFIATSEYYETKNIGLGLVVEQSDDIGSFLEGIQSHCRTLLTWDGEVYKLKSLLDITETHSNILTLRDSELSQLTLGVPLWEATTNELRAEFTSSERGERPDSVTAQDIGNVEILNGRIVPQRIQLPGFNNWNLAYQQTARLLSELSYPWRSAQWEMNRFKSHVAVGDVVRIIWGEFTSQVVTSYWLVMQVQDGGSDDDSIKVTAVEDQTLSPIQGEESDPVIPTVHPWERIVPVDPDDVYLSDLELEDANAFAFVFEVPEVFNDNGGTIIVGMNRLRASHAAARVWRSFDEVTYTHMAFASGNRFEGFAGVIAQVGELVDAMPGNENWNRSAAGFQVDFSAAEFNQIDLDSVTLIDEDTDHLTALGDARLHYILIEEEVMQVGLLEQVTLGRYRMRNIIRGAFGTRVMQHPVDAKVVYFRNWPTNKQFPLVSGEGEEIFFRLQPVERSGFPFLGLGVYVNAQIFHYGDNDTLFLATAKRPLLPEPVSIADGGATVTIVVRPTYHDVGTDIPFYTTARNPIGTLRDQTYAVMQLDAAGVQLSEEPMPNTSVFVAPTLEVPGTVTLVVNKLAGAVVFRVFTQTNRLSNYYAEFSL